MAVSLVVAWSTDLQEILGFRRSVNKRHAQEMAAELEQEFPWSPRISFYEEVDFLATEEGMTEEEKRKALEMLVSEPTLRECPYCHQLHQASDIERCPLKPR